MSHFELSATSVGTIIERFVLWFDTSLWDRFVEHFCLTVFGATSYKQTLRSMSAIQTEACLLTKLFQGLVIPKLDIGGAKIGTENQP